VTRREAILGDSWGRVAQRPQAPPGTGLLASSARLARTVPNGHHSDACISPSVRISATYILFREEFENFRCTILRDAADRCF
jgi:hypothetical protein